MRVGMITPVMGVFGSVRRFMEIGNEMVKRGIDFTLYTPKGGKGCSWFDYKGKLANWSKIDVDYFINGDVRTFKILPLVKAKQIFILVIVGGERHRQTYKSVYGKYPFILNNQAFRKDYPKSYVLPGGVNTGFFRPKPRRVLFQDRAEPWKNAAFIKKQLAGLPGITLVGMKNLNNEQMRKVYQTGDYFVAWESREGWCNTAAEAIASGLTVVTNGFNCEPFLDRVIVVKNLREFFSNPMGPWSWEHMVDKLLVIFSKYK